METEVTVENSITIALKFENSKYVMVGEDGILRAQSDSIGHSETFQLSVIDGKIVALMSYSGKYVSLMADTVDVLATNSYTIGLTEVFQIFDFEHDKAALAAANQLFVQVDEADATLKATSSEISISSVFEIVFLSGEDHLLKSPLGMAIGTEEPVPTAIQEDSDAIFTICFGGTGCSRDEGQATRSRSDMKIYSDKTGYIPIRIHCDISESLKAEAPSISVRGVGENDWATNEDDSEPLFLDGLLQVDASLHKYSEKYSGGNQYSKTGQISGYAAPALALHAANTAAQAAKDQGKKQFNFIGHSRGAVECIMAAWFLYAYGPAEVKNIQVNIFAIDPVPGTGEWYGIFTQLPPNVVNYVGVYAWDMCVQPVDRPFNALVPRPNGLMTQRGNVPKLKNSWWPWDKWRYIADDAQLTDPLAPASLVQPVGYELFACRGRHSTVAGNCTSDSEYKAGNYSEEVTPVPELVYKMARAYLTKWGTRFSQPSSVERDVVSLRKLINTNHQKFDQMGGGETRTSMFAMRPYVRQVSSILGRNPFNTYYMDDVVGDPPYKFAYPVTIERTNEAWVKWKFL